MKGKVNRWIASILTIALVFTSINATGIVGVTETFAATEDVVSVENSVSDIAITISDNTISKNAISLGAEKSAEAIDYDIDSTINSNDLTGNISLVENNRKIETFLMDGVVETTELLQDINLVDKDASGNVKVIYSYLEAVGKSESVIFGHQNDTWHKAGSKNLSNSDSKDVFGSISGVVGIDTLSLTGDEYSARRYNKEIGDTKFPETAEGNVLAAAALTNKNIKEGAIITLSAHMPNFSSVKEDDNYNEDMDPTYAQYDFSGYSTDKLDGDVMNEILPGGLYNKQYRAYLDMVAVYANNVDGTILFRPFHENTNNYYWWGSAFCDKQTYQNVWQYTVEYLRDEKDVHNFLYVYSAGSRMKDVAEYEESYPGDAYVDIVGFDMYNQSPQEDNEKKWFVQFGNQLALVQQVATAHNKLLAVTETGITNNREGNDIQTALLKQGNKHLEWYQVMLDTVSKSNASFFLVWTNLAENNGFYTPFVKFINEDGTLHGHEMLDQFIAFGNDGRSIFAENQKDLLEGMEDKITVEASFALTSASGYITSPVAGRRILKPVTICASVVGLEESESIFLRCNGNSVIDIDDVNLDGKICTAQLTETILEQMGKSEGTIELCVDNQGITQILNTIRVIFNIPEPDENQYEIDEFEKYAGTDLLLRRKWEVNYGAGCNSTVSLTNADGNYCSGEYGLKFEYDVNEEGYAGATISKNIDWTECNALQFWTIPDGKNQKVVVQITADGKVYEVNLNEYIEYADKAEPIFVTIPFQEFVSLDETKEKGGLVENRGKIEAFGIGVNAIAGSDAIDRNGRVSGTIYYDKITATSTDINKTTFCDLYVADITNESAIAYFIPDTTGIVTYETDPIGKEVFYPITVEENKTIALPIKGLESSTEYRLTAQINGGEQKNIKFTTRKDAQDPIQILGIPDGAITYGDTFQLEIKGGSVPENDAIITYEVTTGKDYAEIIEDNIVKVIGAGAVVVKATVSGNNIYESVSTKAGFRSEKAEQAPINVTGITSEVRVNDTITLSTTGGSDDGKITYRILSGGECIGIDLETGKVTALKPGDVSIRVTKASTARYKKATKTVTFTVKEVKEAVKIPELSKPVNQETLKITGIGNTLVFGYSANLKVSGGSGSGAVAYAVASTGNYATVDAKTGKVHATGIGKVTITVTKAGDSKYNPAKASVTFTTIMPRKGASIQVGSAKYKVTNTANKKEALAYMGIVDKSMKKITIPSTVKIGKKNYKVTVINKNALKKCNQLTSVVIGKNITAIGDGAFEGCASLTKITIPINVKTIGKKAFYKAGNLKTITVKSKKVIKVGSYAFKGINKKAIIKVPKAKKKAYNKIFGKKGQAKTVRIK